MRLSCHAAYAHHVLADDAAALAAATRTETLAQERGDLVWQSRAAVCRALVHHEIGDLDTAIDLLTPALALRCAAPPVTTPAPRRSSTASAPSTPAWLSSLPRRRRCSRGPAASGSRPATPTTRPWR
jgi:hypothetical protein